MLSLNKKMPNMATTNTCREEKTCVNFFFMSAQTQHIYIIHIMAHILILTPIHSDFRRGTGKGDFLFGGGGGGGGGESGEREGSF